jgi:hypothetical protein
VRTVDFDDSDVMSDELEDIGVFDKISMVYVGIWRRFVMSFILSVVIINKMRNDK